MWLTAQIGQLSQGWIHPVYDQTGETKWGHIQLAYLGSNYTASTGPKSNKVAYKGLRLV